MSLADGTADIDNLTVRVDRARHGLGRWLLTALLEEAERRHVAEVLLEVRHDNDPAIALYMAEGFVAINRRRDYYAPGLDAIIMRRRLDDRHVATPGGSGNG
jgi:ribosomal protein S18 acetylase RimI-like enzyme